MTLERKTRILLNKKPRISLAGAYKMLEKYKEEVGGELGLLSFIVRFKLDLTGTQWTDKQILKAVEFSGCDAPKDKVLAHLKWDNYDFNHNDLRLVEKSRDTRQRRKQPL